MAEEDRKTLNYILTKAIKRGYYQQIGGPREYLKFRSFGSLNCFADIFDAEGRRVDINYPIRTEESHRYNLVPESELPQALREKLSDLEQHAQSQHSCTGLIDGVDTADGLAKAMEELEKDS